MNLWSEAYPILCRWYSSFQPVDSRFDAFHPWSMISTFSFVRSMILGFFSTPCLPLDRWFDAFCHYINDQLLLCCWIDDLIFLSLVQNLRLFSLSNWWLMIPILAVGSMIWACWPLIWWSTYIKLMNWKFSDLYTTIGEGHVPCHELNNLKK